MGDLLSGHNQANELYVLQYFFACFAFLLEVKMKASAFPLLTPGGLFSVHGKNMAIRINFKLKLGVHSQLVFLLVLCYLFVYYKNSSQQSPLGYKKKPVV